jgi:glycosyltransferase involved in cell wall biosynthesis
MQPPEKVDISIVVPTFNRARMLRHALESLAYQETEGAFTFEIVVVDDGSTDDTAVIIREAVEKYPELTWQYFHQEHRGVSVARNRGVASARGRWIAFFDDDQRAKSFWLAELYQTAVNKKVDCVDGAVALELPESLPFDPGRKTRAFFGEKFFSKVAGPHFSKDYRGTGNIMIKKDLLAKVGGFDASLPVWEDTDLFWRLEKMGISAWFAPQALVYHLIPESRLDEAYLKKATYKGGFTYARIVHKNAGLIHLVFFTLQRLSILLCRDFILFATRSLSGPKAQLVDAKIGMWWNFAFFRGSLVQLMPSIFPQKKFIHFLFLEKII